MKAEEIEMELEGDLKYFAKLAWFERILRRWSDGEVEGDEEEPDGRDWVEGWSERMRMLWRFM